MAEKLSPERAIRLLRAKAAELEHRVLTEWDSIDTPLTTIGLNLAVLGLATDISLIASLLADHMERSPGPWGPEDEDWSDVDPRLKQEFREGFDEGRPE
jgi:hypothetical protein